MPPKSAVFLQNFVHKRTVCDAAFIGFIVVQDRLSVARRLGKTHCARNDCCTGSLVVHETGESTAYGLFYAQDSGRLFIGPGVPVYEGMIVGSNPKGDDIVINVCKKKHATNTRASGSDDALKLTPHTVLSLEQSLEFIADDELVEITPKSIRMRKMVLSKELRMKQAAKKK